MANPATTLARAGQDERIPGLPVLPPGTDPATLTVPVYNSATDQTHQAPIGGPATNSNAVVGAPKLVLYLDSRYHGVPAAALTLDRLAPATIVPGTLATVDNPSSTPLATTEPPKQYVATLVPAGTAGAVLVPRYIGAAVSDVVPIVWQEVITGPGASYTDQQARAAQLNRAAPTGAIMYLDSSERADDYGTNASGKLTINAANCLKGVQVRFTVGAGASKPEFVNVPSTRPVKYVPADIYVAGTEFNYSVLVCLEKIEVAIYPS